jgi:hypothetical protein
LSDPATLISCPFCDAANWPDDRFCHSCKKDIWDEKRIQLEKDMEKYEKKQYQDYLELEIESEIADGNIDHAKVLQIDLDKSRNLN